MSSEKPQTDLRDHLLWLTAGPSVWTVHFLISYISAAIWCEKAASVPSDTVSLRIGIALATAIALLLIGWVGWISFRRHRIGDAALPHDFDSRLDQRRFLGFAAFLLALLSGIATIFTALAFVFIGTCD